MADDGLSIEIDGEKELQQSLEQAAQALSPDGLIPPMRSATMLVTRGAKMNAPVDTGRLRASITPEVMQHMQEVRGIVGSNVKYAPYQELGFRRHFVLAKYIGVWAKRHGLGFTGLFVSGKAKRYLQRAFEDNKEKIMRIFEKAVSDAVK